MNLWSELDVKSFSTYSSRWRKKWKPARNHFHPPLETPKRKQTEQETNVNILFMTGCNRDWGKCGPDFEKHEHHQGHETEAANHKIWQLIQASLLPVLTKKECFRIWTSSSWMPSRDLRSLHCCNNFLCLPSLPLFQSFYFFPFIPLFLLSFPSVMFRHGVSWRDPARHHTTDAAFTVVWKGRWECVCV